MRRSHVVAALLLATMFGAACTDDGTSSQEEPEPRTVAAGAFMEDVCTSISNWLADFLAGNQEVAALEPNASVEQSRKKLETFLDNAVASTDELIDAVEEAGVPDASGGESFASRLTGSLEQASSALDDAQAQLAQVPDDPARFREATLQIGDTVRAQLAAATDALGELGPALTQVARDTPACQSLGGAVGGGG
jgi:hypothetical protein